MDKITDDEKTFGPDRWVYCKQHGRSHITGWCTVHIDDKVLLDARSPEDARIEARSKGFKIYGE